VITFDDGYQDNYEFALPILAKYQLPATIYLVSSTLTEGRVLWTSRLRQAFNASRKPVLCLEELNPEPFVLGDMTSVARSARLMTNILNQMPAPARQRWIDRIGEETEAPPAPLANEWFLTLEQIKEMQQHRITFGSHTVSHPNLPGLSEDNARCEIAQSRQDLRLLIDTEILHFSYPNSGALHPHFNRTVVGLVREADYRSAVTSDEGPCRHGSDVLRLQRIGINRARSSPERFGMLLEATRFSRSTQLPVALD
jgi:peptidoglycan/xylan/chitin deacetylase (PgdA/CDA1 family)